MLLRLCVETLWYDLVSVATPLDGSILFFSLFDITAEMLSIFGCFFVWQLFMSTATECLVMAVLAILWRFRSAFLPILILKLRSSTKLGVCFVDMC